MKTKVKYAVDFAYGFDTGRSRDSITRNVTHAQALLVDATFIYRVRLIASHMQPTEHHHFVHRIWIWILHVIHIDTPQYRKLSISLCSGTRTALALSFLITLALSHSKSLPLQLRWYGLKPCAFTLDFDGLYTFTRSSAALTSGPPAHCTSLVGRKSAAKKFTFRISTRLFISILTAHAPRVEFSCSRSNVSS